MASLLTHIFASVALILLAIWHIFSSYKSYLKTPSQYASKPIYPIVNRFKTLELYLQLVVILLAIFYYLLISTVSDPLVKGSTPVYQFTTLQTAAVLAVFLVLTLAALASENAAFLPLPPGYHFLVAAIAFGLQWMVLESGAGLTSGIEGKCESLLGRTAGICCGLALLVAFQPRLFLADLGLWSAVLLQGLWYFQSGLTIHVSGFIPEGCHRLLDVPGGVEGSTQCDLEASRIRALALLDLLYVVYVIVVVIIDLIICGLVGRALGVRKHGSGGYEPLSNISLNSNHKLEA